MVNIIGPIFYLFHMFILYGVGLLHMVHLQVYYVENLQSDKNENRLRNLLGQKDIKIE